METMTKQREQQEQIETLTAQVADLTSKIEKMRMLVMYYENQFLNMKRRQFGASSERTQIDDADYRQMGLQYGDQLETVTPPPEPVQEEITYKRKKRVGKREDDLSRLKVERINYEKPESERVCPQCGETMRDIGVDVHRELKLVPAQVVVVEHAAHTYACAGCQKNSESTPIIKASAPNPLISGSLASPSLVAHIAVQKYSNGMPLYRLEKGFVYDGVNISRQTMVNWVIKCSLTYLKIIYDKMILALLNEAILHADETTLQVLRELGRDARSKSYEWIYRTSGVANHKIVIYEYQETRKREHPQTFLKGFKGLLHTDGYEAYHGLPPDIIIIGCWAHLRRKWENLYKALPKDKRKNTEAERGLLYINYLFELEREWEGLSPDDRYQQRLEKSKPVADKFFAWVESLGALPKSPLGEPVHYALSQRRFLENVYLDGRAEFTNNRCERSVKPFVQGRKAWLFSNTPDGATASSIMFSIVETAKENGLHPFHYLVFLLTVLPGIKIDQVDSLLPWSSSLPESCKALGQMPAKKFRAGKLSTPPD